jgi:putative peptidoglycan lipid II flippase
MALPAGIGLVLVAEPATRLLFERGAFTALDAQRAATMIGWYSSAAWAYCALPVLVRGYYAMEHRATPARIGVVALGVNLALTLGLIWPLGERGLAISTAAAASVQAILLAAVFSRTGTRLAWRELSATIGKGALATGAMALTVMLLGYFTPEHLSRSQSAVWLVLAICSGATAYVAAAWVLRMGELRILLRRRGEQGILDSVARRGGE